MQEQELSKEYMDTRQICELFHVTTKTVYRWRDAGKLTGKKVGRSYLFKREEVLKLLED